MKKPLLLVPGLLCDDAVWASQAATLADIAAVHVANNGEVDSLGALAESIIAQAPARRKIYIHINNTNPILSPGSIERSIVEQAGVEIARDGLEIIL